MKTTMLITLALVLNLSMTFASENMPKKPIMNVVESNYQMLLTQAENDMVEFVLLKTNSDVFKVKVYDTKGDRLFTKRIKKNNKSKTSFEISELPTGTYTFLIERNGEELETRPVIKK